MFAIGNEKVTLSLSVRKCCNEGKDRLDCETLKANEIIDEIQQHERLHFDFFESLN